MSGGRQSRGVGNVKADGGAGVIGDDKIRNEYEQERTSGFGSGQNARGQIETI